MGFGWRYTLYMIIKPGTSPFSITVQVIAPGQLWRLRQKSTKQVSPPARAARGWYGDTYTFQCPHSRSWTILSLRPWGRKACPNKLALDGSKLENGAMFGSRWPNVSPFDARRCLWCIRPREYYRLGPRGWLTFVNGECSMDGDPVIRFFVTLILFRILGLEKQKKWTWHFSIQ